MFVFGLLTEKYEIMRLTLYIMAAVLPTRGEEIPSSRTAAVETEGSEVSGDCNTITRKWTVWGGFRTSSSIDCAGQVRMGETRAETDRYRLRCGIRGVSRRLSGKHSQARRAGTDRRDLGDLQKRSGRPGLAAVPESRPNVAPQIGTYSVHLAI